MTNAKQDRTPTVAHGSRYGLRRSSSPGWHSGKRLLSWLQGSASEPPIKDPNTVPASRTRVLI